MTASTEWSIQADPPALAAEAARRFVDSCNRSIAARGRCIVALSGGSTPRALYHLLAAPPYRDAVNWACLHVAWGDERCVPPDHADSNYRLARETLLDRVPVPAEQVYRMPADMLDHESSAAAYETTLRNLFAEARVGAHFPRFDLIYLGLGVEGHTVSLFPGSSALRETARWVAAPYVEKLHDHRLTLTLPVLNNAREVVFLVAGAEKAGILRRVIADPPEKPLLPAAAVRPVGGHLLWLVDRAAASSLDGA